MADSSFQVAARRCRISNCGRILEHEGRENGEGYCKYHLVAYSRILNGFTSWSAAYGNISWERYLETILGLKETGEWARQVAADLVSQPRKS